MFRDIQRVFRESMAAFRSEAGRREPEDQVVELLSAMKREMVAARANLRIVKEEVDRARRELERERSELEQCERRKGLAERIGDAETARVAEGFAARHREKVGVLEQKVRAAEAEHELRLREIDEMKARYQEADANRFALLAQIRRGASAQRMRSALDGGAFDDFDRMQESVEGNAAYADALDDLSAPPSPPPPPPDVDDRLRELKRRMGKD